MAVLCHAAPGSTQVNSLQSDQIWQVFAILVKGPLHGRQGITQCGERTIGIFLSRGESYTLPPRFAFIDGYERNIQCSPHSMATNVTGSSFFNRLWQFFVLTNWHKFWQHFDFHTKKLIFWLLMWIFY